MADIYLSLIKITSVGAVATLISLGTLILTMFMGKLSDKFKKTTLIKIASFLIIILWLVRYVFDSELSFYIIALVSGLCFAVFKVPYYAKLFSIPEKSKVDEFFIFREIPVYLGRMVVFVLALIFITNLKILFPIAGLMYLYFLFW